NCGQLVSAGERSNATRNNKSVIVIPETMSKITQTWQKSAHLNVQRCGCLAAQGRAQRVCAGRNRLIGSAVELQLAINDSFVSIETLREGNCSLVNHVAGCIEQIDPNSVARTGRTGEASADSYASLKAGFVSAGRIWLRESDLARRKVTW